MSFFNELCSYLNFDAVCIKLRYGACVDNSRFNGREKKNQIINLPQLMDHFGAKNKSH